MGMTTSRLIALLEAAAVRWRHSRSPTFIKQFDALPKLIQDRARAMFKILQADPSRTDLQPLTGCRDTYRISIGTYRAAATRTGNQFRWHFIGSHQDYDRVSRKR